MASLLELGKVYSKPLDILPPVARQPSFPAGSDPSYVAMMNGMLKAGHITPQMYRQMMTDPRQYEGMSNPPQSGEIY
jgi:hypothetical protein